MRTNVAAGLEFPFPGRPGIAGSKGSRASGWDRQVHPVRRPSPTDDQAVTNGGSSRRDDFDVAQPGR